MNKKVTIETDQRTYSKMSRRNEVIQTQEMMSISNGDKPAKNRDIGPNNTEAMTNLQ